MLGSTLCWAPGIRPVPDPGQVISVGERRGWAVPSSPGADGNGIFSLSCSSADAVVARSFAGQFPMGADGIMVFGPMMDIKNLILLSGGFSRKFVLRLWLGLSKCSQYITKKPQGKTPEA